VTKLLTPDEVIAVLGISMGTFHALVKAQQIAVVDVRSGLARPDLGVQGRRVCRTVRVRPEDLEAFIACRRQAPRVEASAGPAVVTEARALARAGGGRVLALPGATRYAGGAS
jgi:helix-turn-helix protein